MDECFLLRLPVEILLRIFGCLEVISILHLRSTCKCAYNTGQLVWSVDRTLKRFVNDPIAFRTKMRDNGAVISGGLALQFFANRIWKESDMDVFVRTGMERIALMEYLVMKEGYEDDGSGESPMYAFGQVRTKVEPLRKGTHEGPPTL